MSQARGFAGGDVVQEIFAIAATICVLQGAAPICFAINFTNEPPMKFAVCSEKIDTYTINIFSEDDFLGLSVTSFQIWCQPVTRG